MERQEEYIVSGPSAEQVAIAEKPDRGVASLSTVNKLHLLYDLEQCRDSMPEVAELDARIAALQAERKSMTAGLDESIQQLTDLIKQEVVAGGSTVKGEHYQAVYMSGRESWDGKLLAGFAIAHPEILVARKVGEPSVSLRKVTVKESK